MSKYEPLWDYIKAHNYSQIYISFDDIKVILGFDIDHSFLTYKNELLLYGYRVEKISMKNKMIRIIKAVTSERLVMFPLTDSEMQQVIKRESDDTLKQAYSEMLIGCRKNPENRAWSALWAMQLKSSNQIVGNLSFKGLNEDGMVEIGYGIYPEYKGKGLMTEAVTAMVKWACNEPGISRVEAESEADNKASQQVLLKSGFLFNGKMGIEGPRYVYLKNSSKQKNN